MANLSDLEARLNDLSDWVADLADKVAAVAAATGNGAIPVEPPEGSSSEPVPGIDIPVKGTTNG